jgi:hypothetical protein
MFLMTCGSMHDDAKGHTLIVVLPGGFIVEQVITFSPYLEAFCQELAALGYHIRVLRMDTSAWVRWPRLRPALR